MTAPRRGRKLPQVLTRGQVNKLLAQPKGTEPTDLRDRALLELMYACGLRASEAIGLRGDDVDLDEGSLRARGKGSKERVVPVGNSAVEAVRRYLERGRPALVHSGSEKGLFVNFRGSSLTRQGLYKIVRRHATTAGLADRMSPHTLRHTFATHLLAGAATCARCRRCSATPTWRPPSSTRTSPASGSRTCTSARTRAPPRAEPPTAVRRGRRRQRLLEPQHARAARGRDGPPPARASPGGPQAGAAGGARRTLVRARAPR